MIRRSIMRLSKVIPWGRSKREYELMFDLGPAELNSKILGCGDGPASFNAEMRAEGHSVVSCDPIYSLTPEQIREDFRAGVEPIMSQVRNHLDDYVWKFHASPEELLEYRKMVIRDFLEDYPAGQETGRYVVGELPELPFEDQQFDLSLCSHFLFLYSRLLSREFHLASIVELCRVSREARVFPLTSLECELSPHLSPVIKSLEARGFEAELVEVPYQLQRNGNQMLRVRGRGGGRLSQGRGKRRNKESKANGMPGIEGS
jgi:hypothetical protein